MNLHTRAKRWHRDPMNVNDFHRKSILGTILVTALVTTTASFAQDRIYDQQQLILVKKYMQAAIKYLEESQVKETKGHSQFRGEWISRIIVDKTTPFLGLRGKQANDSNNFTTASIYNLLAPIYLSYPEYRELPSMLNMGISNILRYQHPEKFTFGFWQRIPKRKHIWTAAERAAENPPLVRRSNNIFYKFRFVNNVENVADDADDTAQSYVSLKYQEKLHQLEQQIFSPVDIQSKQLTPFFSSYLDLNRKRVANIFNIKQRGTYNTGAFLTWFLEEVPGPSDMLPKPDKTYIPFGVNDVDCVVNSNVLGALALYNELDRAEGVEASCKYLQQMVSLGKYRECGMYYPNHYNFFYNAIKAYAKGVNCLQPVVNDINDIIVSRQSRGGFWSSFRRHLHNYDQLHTTAYALGTLAQISLLTGVDNEQAIKSAFDYLQRKAQWDGEQVHWDGGIFFSGGTLVRKSIFWESDAYTTAIILDAYANYRKILESARPREALASRSYER